MRRLRLVGTAAIVVGALLSAVASTPAGATPAANRTLSSQASSGSSPLVWTQALNPWRADARAVSGLSPTHPANLNGVSCPTTGFCAAIDGWHGDVLTSSDPQAGASSFSLTTLRGAPWGDQLQAISCPSAQLCVIGSHEGHLWVSTKPAGGYRSWQRRVAPAHSAGNVDGVVCLSNQFCVASDYKGNVWATTNPSGGSSAWHRSKVPAGSNFVANAINCNSTALCWITMTNGVTTSVWETSTPLSGGWHAVSGPAPGPASGGRTSCPTAGFCVKVGQAGAVATAQSSAGPWTTGQIQGWNPLSGVACFGHGSCVATDTAGNLLRGSDLGSHPTWAATHVSGSTFLGAPACPSAHLCLIGDHGGLLVSRTPGGAFSSWRSITIPALHDRTVTTVACASVQRCVLTTAHGQLLASTDPGGPGSSWKLERQLSTGQQGQFPQYFSFSTCTSRGVCFAGASQIVEPEGSLGIGILLSSNDPIRPASWSGGYPKSAGFNGVSCPTAELCFGARDSRTDTISVTHNPAGGLSAWRSLSFPRLQQDPLYADEPADAISCASAQLCVMTGQDSAASDAGAVAVSTDPTRASSWKLQDLSGSPLEGVRCSSYGQCVAWNATGQLFVAKRR